MSECELLAYHLSSLIIIIIAILLFEMERKESKDVYAAIAELPMKNTDYDDVHATTTDIPIENIVSHDNICNDNAHTMAAELQK